MTEGGGYNLYYNDFGDFKYITVVEAISFSFPVK